jgi:hypothetical protein
MVRWISNVHTSLVNYWRAILESEMMFENAWRGPIQVQLQAIPKTDICHGLETLLTYSRWTIHIWYEFFSLFEVQVTACTVVHGSCSVLDYFDCLWKRPWLQRWRTRPLFFYAVYRHPAEPKLFVRSIWDISHSSLCHQTSLTYGKTQEYVDASANEVQTVVYWEYCCLVYRNWLRITGN